MSTVTKSDLCSRVSKKIATPATEIKPVVEAFLDEVLLVMAEEHRIEIRGFGIFTVKHRKPRIGRNPRTGETITVDACHAPVFKFSREAQTTFSNLKKKAPAIVPATRVTIASQ